MKKECSYVPVKNVENTFRTMKEEQLYIITEGSYEGVVVYKPAACSVVVKLSGGSSGWVDPLPAIKVKRLPDGTTVTLTQTSENE